MSTPIIERFLTAVGRRLKTGIRSRVVSRCLLAGSAAALLWALGWRVFGYAAPREGYAVAVVLALVAGAIWMRISRPGVRDAAHQADSLFDLKDGLISWLDFKAAGLDGETYQLNERDLTNRISSLDVSDIPVPRTRKAFTAGAIVSAIVFALALLPHSTVVRDRLAAEEVARLRSAEIAKQVEEAVEEIIESMTEEEREELDPAALREWVKQLEATKDPRESEKQLARLEQQIAKAMQGLEARQDEAVLKLAAQELAKSSMADVRQLGKQLEARDYDRASQNLKDMKPGAKRKLTAKELAKLRKNAAKSRDMAKRMADGARRRDFGKMRASDGRSGKAGEQGMDKMLEELDADARELDGELADLGEMDDMGEELGMMAGRLGEGMDKLGMRFRKLGARQKARNKLKALRGGLGQARRFAKGKSASMSLAQGGQGNQPGGLAPGTGTDNSRREQRDEFQDNGNMAQLKGQQNADGPSSSSVESAESGGGVAGRANVAKQREFKQQFESLVHRDDIPESLKLGVREYFERVHETEPESE